MLIGYQVANLAVNLPNPVFGPLPSLQQVSAITGTIDVTGARDDLLQRVSIAPRNAAGVAVAGLEWSPTRCSEPRHPAASATSPSGGGARPGGEPCPATGGQRLGRAVDGDPGGADSVLNSLPSFVKTLPVTITNAAT